jgi:hypothetical protein
MMTHRELHKELTALLRTLNNPVIEKDAVLLRCNEIIEKLRQTGWKYALYEKDGVYRLSQEW